MRGHVFHVYHVGIRSAHDSWVITFMIISICHNGNCTPLYMCQIVNIIGSVPDVKAMHFGKEVFLPNKKELDGVVDISLGVTVIYSGNEYRDTIIKSWFWDYVRKNRNRLVEQWHNSRVLRG